MSARLTSASASVVAEPVVRAIVSASSSAAISSTGWLEYFHRRRLGHLRLRHQVGVARHRGLPERFAAFAERPQRLLERERQHRHLVVHGRATIGVVREVGGGQRRMQIVERLLELPAGARRGRGGERGPVLEEEVARVLSACRAR